MEQRMLMFEDLKCIKDSWVDIATKRLEKNADLRNSDVSSDIKRLQDRLQSEEDKAAFRNVQNDIIEGVIHSILVMLDGGTMLADKYIVDLIDYHTKESLKANIALHEEFIGYLLDNECE